MVFAVYKYSMTFCQKYVVACKQDLGAVFGKPWGSEQGESLLLCTMIVLVGMLAFSCVGQYWVQGVVNEELIQFKARKEEVATLQEDLVNLRDQMVAFEQTFAVVSSPRKKLNYPLAFLMSRCCLSSPYSFTSPWARWGGRSSPSSTCWRVRGRRWWGPGSRLWRRRSSRCRRSWEPSGTCWSPGSRGASW